MERSRIFFAKICACDKLTSVLVRKGYDKKVKTRGFIPAPERVPEGQGC